MTTSTGAYEIDDSLDRIDFDRVHRWLSGSYWSPGVPRELVERAARNSSLAIGAYDRDGQAGFLRIVSDRTTFAWVCDVWVDQDHRGRGLARAMLRFALDHPEHRNLRRWILATRDAHSVYAAVGFRPIPNPERWMIHIPDPNAWPQP